MATNKEDLSLSVPPVEMDEVAPQAQCSWREMMDEMYHEIPPLFELYP